MFRFATALACVGLAISCASTAQPAVANCVVPEPGTETSTATLATVRTDGAGRRTVRSAEGVEVTAGPDGELEIVGVDGKKIVVASNGTVRSAERDVVVVRADGTRKVWDYVTKTLLDEASWTAKRTGASVEADPEPTAVAAAEKTAVSREPEAAAEAGDDGAKATICHVPPGNPGNQHTLSVGASAVSAHLKHGDYEGECDPARAVAKEHGKGAEKGSSARGSGGKNGRGNGKKG